MHKGFLPDCVDNSLLHTRACIYPQPGTHSVTRDETQEAIAEWLGQVAKMTNKSLTQIARKAGVNQTTVTRAYKNPENYQNVMSTSTIMRIVNEHKVPPPPLPGFGQAVGFAEPEVIPIEDPDLRGDDLTPDQYAIEVNTRAMMDAGYMPGDMMLVDMAETPRDGDAVIAQNYDNQQGTAETVFRRFKPPHLVAISPDHDQFEPLYVDGKKVMIVGVVVKSWRCRKHSNAA